MPLEYLVVGGGGGGGGDAGGGGGGGDVRTSVFAMGIGGKAVIVANGGGGGAPGGSSTLDGVVVAAGGGGGASSLGHGGSSGTGRAGGSQNASGGGGGAGANGDGQDAQNVTQGHAGFGGPGLLIWGVAYAGGGGGGGNYTCGGGTGGDGHPAVSGGSGGSADNAPGPGPANAGSPNTGGGGGGGAASYGGTNGGSGIVIVRYPIGSGYAGTGGSIVDASGYRYHRFTNSGTFTLTAQPAPPNVTVPNVVGQTEAAARSAITGAQLAVGTVSYTPHATIAAGITISQNPGAGASVPQASAVSFVVSTGVQMVVVPNVVGATETAARTAITARGLVVGTVTYVVSLTVPKDITISQAPAAGASVVVGSAVALTVSSGATASGMFLAASD